MNKKKILILALAGIGVLGVSGCSAGSTIDTSLQVNEDLSGQRTMTISLDDSVFAQYFNGTIDDLNSYISEYCPEQLEWSVSAEEGYNQYEFDLLFGGVDEYKSKVDILTGMDSVLEISVPDTIWASGIYINEDFTSEDLLKWLSDGLVEAGYVSADNASMIFSVGNTEVDFNGNQYSTYECVNVDEVDYVNIDEINVYTDMSDFDSYSRKVEFVLPDSSLTSRASDIDGFFQNMSDNNIDVSVEEDETTTTYLLEQENLDIDGINAFDKAVFGAENADLQNINQDGITDPLTFERVITENFKLTEYVVGNAYAPCFSYYVKVPDEYSVYDEFGAQAAENAEHTGYRCVLSDYETDRSVVWNLKKHFTTQTMKVNLYRNQLTESWKQKIQLTLGEAPTEDEVDGIKNMILDRVDTAEVETEENNENVLSTEEIQSTEDSGQKKSDISVDIKQNKDEKYQITITQKGKCEDFLNNLQKLTGSAAYALYGEDRGFWKVKKQEAYSITCDYTGLIGKTTDDFILEYHLDLGLFPNMQYKQISGDDDTALIKGKELIFTQTTPNVYISYAGTKIDIWSVIFWLLMSVGVLLVITTVLTSGVIKTKKKTYVLEEHNKEKKKQQIAFCENCGAPRTDNSKFCENCGAKFDE